MPNSSLSGSYPIAMNEYYENVFDIIQYVEHDKKDKTIIYKIHGSGGEGHEIIPFAKPVRAVGNIEDWLMTLFRNLRVTFDKSMYCWYFLFPKRFYVFETIAW